MELTGICLALDKLLNISNAIKEGDNWQIIARGNASLYEIASALHYHKLDIVNASRSGEIWCFTIESEGEENESN